MTDDNKEFIQRLKGCFTDVPVPSALEPDAVMRRLQTVSSVKKSEGRPIHIGRWGAVAALVVVAVTVTLVALGSGMSTKSDNAAHMSEPMASESATGGDTMGIEELPAQGELSEEPQIEYGGPVDDDADSGMQPMNSMQGTTEEQPTPAAMAPTTRDWRVVALVAGGVVALLLLVPVAWYLVNRRRRD